MPTLAHSNMLAVYLPTIFKFKIFDYLVYIVMQVTLCISPNSLEYMCVHAGDKPHYSGMSCVWKGSE